MRSVHILHALALLRRLTICASIARRLWRAHLLSALAHVGLSGIYWGGVVRHLLLRLTRGHRALWSTSSIAVGVAGRATELLLILHGRR